MGNSASGDFEDDIDKFDGIDTLGYRVLGVQPNSPASAAGLVSFFDFLVGANGKMLLGSSEGLEIGDEYDDVDFPGLLQEFVGKELELLVWNIKSQEKRLVNIVPQKDWGGAGLLGVTIRMDNYGGADERLIRVLDMEKNSPAAIAGLVPEQDYLLGTTRHSLEDAADLANLLQANVDRVVELYVYNTTSDVVRIVTLMPTWSWGGKGLLGAEVGTGYLHRLPQSCRGTNGSSIERKVVTRKRQQQQQGKETDSKTAPGQEPAEEADDHLCMAPQLEMEPEPGQAHAMPLPDLHGAAPQPPQPPKKPEEETVKEERSELKEPAESPEIEPESDHPVPPPPLPAEQVEKAPEPGPVPPPPPPPPPEDAQPVPPPPPPPPPPEVETTSSSVAMAYAAPSATNTRAAAAAAAASHANGKSPFSSAKTGYASSFLPPPPISHLSSAQKE